MELGLMDCDARIREGEAEKTLSHPHILETATWISRIDLVTV
jgi:hypothetical protein